MPALTGQQIVDNVIGHLGDRTDGNIGNKPVLEAVVDSLNRGLLKVFKKFQVDSRERNVDLQLTSASAEYALPTLDVDNNTIEIFNFIRGRLILLDDNTVGYPLVRISVTKRDQLFPVTSVEQSARPLYYTVFNRVIEFHPFPVQSYTAKFRVNILPDYILLTRLDLPQPFGMIWDDVLEEFTTADCFAKLQQTVDSRIWMDKYDVSLKQTTAIKRDKPDWDIDSSMMDLRRIHPGNPELDPFVTSMGGSIGL